MKSLLITAALALGLATSATSADAAIHGIILPGHGGLHGIPIHRCWHHRGPWCHHHPVLGRVVGHTIGLNGGVHGLVIRHPIGVPAHNGVTTIPNHGGLVNGIPAEQRVAH